MVQDCHVETIFSKLGKPGRYQILCFAMCCIFVYHPVINYIIISAVSGISAKHSCYPSTDYISRFSNNNNNNNNNRNITIDDLVFGQCSVSLKQNTSRGENEKKIECEKWSYEDGEHGPVDTIVTQWDLVCSKSFYPMLVNTLFFIGVLSGAMLTGHMSDQYGRRPVLLSFAIVSSILTCASVFSPNIYVYIAIRFVAGMCLSGVHSTANVLCMEQTQAKYNYIINLVLLINFLCSITIGAFVAWMVQSWWKVQLYLTIPVVVTSIIGIFALPESYHWLVVHKKKKKLDKHVSFAAKFNGIVAPVTDFLLKDNEEKEEIQKKKNKKTYSIIQILRFPEMRKRLVLMGSMMVFGTLSFYIMTLNTRELSDNPYKVIMVSAAFDVVPVLITFPALKRFGKRRWFMACFGFSGTLCIIYKFYNHIALMVAGKMFIGVGMAISFLYSCDIFPTVVRNVCMGVTVLMGRFGGILAPQVVLLGRYSAPDYPVLLSGILLLLTMVLGYFLPDMTNKRLPKTIEEVENHAKQIEEKEKEYENGDMDELKSSLTEV